MATFYRDPTYLDYVLSLAGPTKAFWPLNDTSWSTTANTIEEVFGVSDGAEDHWVDHLADGVPPTSGGAIGSGLFGTSTKFTATNSNGVGATTPSGDRLHLGDFPSGSGTITNDTGTCFVFLKITDFNTCSGTSQRLMQCWSGEVMSVLINTTPNILRIGNSQTQIGDVSNFEGKLMIIALVQTSASSASARLFFDGALQYTGSYGATLDSGSAQTEDAELYTLPRPNSNSNIVSWQHFWYLPDVALTDEQLIQILAYANGTA
jgi:hypothetical protein